MKKFILLLSLLLIAGAGYWYYTRFAAGPEYSLVKAAAAVQAHDVAAFEQYVDVSSVASKLVDQVTQQGSALKLIAPGSMAFSGALRMLKPQLAQAARQEVQRYVKTGSATAAAETAQSGRVMNVSLLGIASKVVGPDSRFKDVQYVKQENDQQALVGLEFTQPKYDTTLVVELKMLNRGDHWQVTEITNTGELIKHVARLEKQRLVGR